MVDDTDVYASSAQLAAAAAIEVANHNFGQALDMRIKGPRGDVVTRVDHESERVIVSMLRARYPDHAIEAEESGRISGDSEFMWLIDPLDGTNNYAYGLPMYGTAVTLCHRGEPMVTAIGEAHTGDVACAIKGRGLLLNAKPFKRADPSPYGMPATALWIGYHAQHDEHLGTLTSELYARSRRLFSTWAPTIDVFLYLRGGLDAIAIYKCTGTELLGALLLLREAGAEVWGADGTPPAGLGDLPELSFAGDPAVVPSLLSAIRLPTRL